MLGQVVGRLGTAQMNLMQRFAYDAADTDDTRSEKVAIFLVASSCCIAGLVWSAIYSAVLGWGVSAALPLGFTVGVGATLLVAHYRRMHRIAIYAQLSGIIGVTAFLQWSLGGLFDSGFVLAWGFLGPIGALFFFSYRRAIPWFLVYFATLLITVAFDGYFAAHGPDVPRWAPPMFFIMNLGASSAIVFIFAAYLVNAAAVQRKRADDLLLNTLPRQIVPILKAGTRTIAEHYDSASVLFADVVGSTPLFAELAPSDVVGWLNDVYSGFDEVIARHGAEKIRTIGDNYMVATGVPVRRGDHAKLAARVALDMLQTARSIPGHHGRHLAFRIGINSGPLVAGVIGRAKFQYDLWGDTVNLAARMESHGEPGRVHLTQDTYQLIEDEFECERRDSIDIKGRGTMTTWFLIGPRQRS